MEKPTARVVISERQELEISAIANIEATEVVEALYSGTKRACPDDKCGLDYDMEERGIEPSTDLGSFVTVVTVVCKEGCKHPEKLQEFAETLLGVAGQLPSEED